MPTALRSLFPRRPSLPVPLAWPLSLIPGAAHSAVLAKFLNILFAASIQSGEFEFLRDRVLAVEVRDAKIKYRFCFTGLSGFVPRSIAHSPDLTLSGAIYDFLALATRREDSDTLFFSRRVVMEGDTALGLELKNWLDGADLDALGGPLPPLLRAMNGCMGVYERLGGH
ncbi:MAG TPA: sterol-binding protein [Gammaproteobacteria bacterium]|nr:sterol-binding protein [Gammaproteobacteria bacterium]HRF45846.1 SCP2 sterol-binding domain-containing protein [Candidatus Competibacteraceae bacterium]